MYALLVAPTDLRPPRGLPARSPSAPRASLGASARSPARPRRPRGGLQSVGVSVCCTARPRHRPPALQPGTLGPPAPSTPVGPGVLTCGSARRLEGWPGPATVHGHRSRVLRTPNVVWLVVLGFWGAPLRVVTNVVNPRCFSCGFLPRCYKRRQSEGFFAENSGFWA